MPKKAALLRSANEKPVAAAHNWQRALLKQLNRPQGEAVTAIKLENIIHICAARADYKALNTLLRCHCEQLLDQLSANLSISKVRLHINILDLDIRPRFGYGLHPLVALNRCVQI